MGFGYFKLAVIAEGIHHRFLQGKTVGEGFSHFGAAVPLLLSAAVSSVASMASRPVTPNHGQAPHPQRTLRRIA